MSSSSMFRVVLVCGLVLYIGTAANATYLTSDYDFNAQTLNAAVGVPWTYVNQYTCLAASQSPFTQVFGNNGKGINTPGGGPPYLVQVLSSSIAPEATGTYYTNWDFRIDNTSATGITSFFLTNDGYRANSSVTVLATLDALGNTAFYAENSIGRGSSLFAPVVGQWYNVQLALDVGANTYSGNIVQYGAGGNTLAASFTNRSFGLSNQAIDRIYSAQEGSGQPVQSFDNIVFSTDVLPSTIPEPGTLVLLGIGLLGLLAYAWRKRK